MVVVVGRGWVPGIVPPVVAVVVVVAATCRRVAVVIVMVKGRMIITNFIRSYLHHFFDDSHGLKTSLKPLRRPFDRCQSRLEAINNGRDIKQINW